MKRSLEIKIKGTAAKDRFAAANALEDAGIEVAEAQSNWVQVRNTTPTEVRRILKTAKVKLISIGEGFSH